jgi:HlyD family secretion protein
MPEMETDRLNRIHINPQQRARPRGAFRGIVLGVVLITLVAGFLAWPKKGDDKRIVSRRMAATPENATPVPVRSGSSVAAPDVVLTVSGYIINRERIELSPRFQGVVKWIGVKKGDSVQKDQVVVLLDDAEQKARLMETEGQLASAKAALEKARLEDERAQRLHDIDSRKLEDDARLEVQSAKAAILRAEGAHAYSQAQLDWTQIRSPIDGVVLERLVDPGELVTPQSFGGTRGPSTAVLAVADPNDLQVEIDVNESDLSKIFLQQKCRVSPEAYPDKTYAGVVAELAPEANRQKGTLQLKVQIQNPDRFLTPELSARFDFLHE